MEDHEPATAPNEQDESTNADDGKANTLDAPRERDEDGPEVDGAIPDA